LTALSDKYKYFNGYAYAGPQQESFLYEASGTTSDWAYGVLGAAGMTFELGTSLYQSCEYFDESNLEVNKKALTYAAKISRAPYSLPKGPDITNATLSANDSSLTILVTASDSSNTANTHPMAEQDVIEIRAYIDNHPYDLLEDGQSPEGIVAMENPSDGNSITVTATKVIDISDLAEGEHIIYLVAKDSLNYTGPVTAFSFEKPTEKEEGLEVTPVIENEEGLEVTPATEREQELEVTPEILTTLTAIEEEMSTTTTTVDCDEEQDDLTPFYVEQLGEEKNCLWISQNMDHFKFLCKYFDNFKHCPRTCDKCGAVEKLKQQNQNT